MFAVLAKIPLLSQKASLAPTINLIDGVDGPSVSDSWKIDQKKEEAT